MQRLPNGEECQRALADSFRVVVHIAVSRSASRAVSQSEPAADAKSTVDPAPSSDAESAQSVQGDAAEQQSIAPRGGSHVFRSGQFSAFAQKYHGEDGHSGNKLFKLTRAAMLTQPLLLQYFEQDTPIPIPPPKLRKSKSAS